MVNLLLLYTTLFAKWQQYKKQLLTLIANWSRDVEIFKCILFEYTY